MKKEANGRFVRRLPGPGDERTWPRRFGRAAHEAFVARFSALANLPASGAGVIRPGRRADRGPPRSCRRASVRRTSTMRVRTISPIAVSLRPPAFAGAGGTGGRACRTNRCKFVTRFHRKRNGSGSGATRMRRSLAFQAAKEVLPLSFDIEPSLCAPFFDDGGLDRRSVMRKVADPVRNRWPVPLPARYKSAGRGVHSSGPRRFHDEDAEWPPSPQSWRCSWVRRILPPHKRRPVRSPERLPTRAGATVTGVESKSPTR